MTGQPRPPQSQPSRFGPESGGAQGGIIGVVSKSTAESIRVYQGRTHYNEWPFVFVNAQPRRPWRYTRWSWRARTDRWSRAPRWSRRTRTKSRRRDGTPAESRPRPAVAESSTSRRSWSPSLGRRAGARWPAPRRRSVQADGDFSHNRFHDRIVHLAAHALDCVVVTRRMHAVREKDDVEILRGIDPERRAGEAGVADRARRQSACRTTMSAASCPSRARASSRARSTVRQSARASRVARSSVVVRASASQHQPRERRRRHRRCRRGPRGRRRRRAPTCSRRAPLPAAAVPPEIELGRRGPLAPLPRRIEAKIFTWRQPCPEPLELHRRAMRSPRLRG